MRSNRLFIVVGVVLAVVAFVGIAAFLGSQQSTASPETATRTVLVANEDIEVGEEVTPAKVEVHEVQPDAVAGTPLADPSMLGNRPALFSVAPGQQVNQETFGNTANGVVDIAGQLRPGERAIAFQVDRVTGLDFILRQGDVIDVVVSVDLMGDGERVGRTVKAVLQGKRVLYVSSAELLPVAGATNESEGEEPEGEQVPLPPADQAILIFAGTDQDAEVVKFAQRDMGEVGSITVALRGRGDDQTQQTTGITLAELIDEYGVVTPSTVDVENAAANAAP